MAVLRDLAPGVLVAGQIGEEDLAVAKARGVVRIINNRPDHEEPGQPTSAEIEAAARIAGLEYVHAPVRGLPDASVVAAVGDALEDGACVLLFCKSGMRSAAAWALASSRFGATREDILKAAAGAGYDLSGLLL